MAVVSVDLACGDYADVGVVVMATEGGGIRAHPVRLATRGLRGRPTVDGLADGLERLARESRARWIVVDGPQGWKAPDNGLEHSRRCERECATPGKTGLPGHAKPGGYLDFITFSIDLFDALSARGWPRLPDARLPGSGAKHAIESFPTSAWRCLGIPPLPGKRRADASALADRLRSLRRMFPVDCDGELSHDELQALVAGLAGIAFDRGDPEGVLFAGVAPVRIEGTWREGFIVNPSRRSGGEQGRGESCYHTAPAP